MTKPFFELGQVVATKGAMASTTGDQRIDILDRHVHGDWGVVDEEDWATNNDALINKGRILSAYAIDPTKPCKGYGENTIWILTEWDRSVTTFLLPEEY